MMVWNQKGEPESEFIPKVFVFGQTIGIHSTHVTHPNEPNHFLRIVCHVLGLIDWFGWWWCSPRQSQTRMKVDLNRWRGSIIIYLDFDSIQREGCDDMVLISMRKSADFDRIRIDNISNSHITPAPPSDSCLWWLCQSFSQWSIFDRFHNHQIRRVHSSLFRGISNLKWESFFWEIQIDVFCFFKCRSFNLTLKIKVT